LHRLGARLYGRGNKSGQTSGSADVRQCEFPGQTLLPLIAGIYAVDFAACPKILPRPTPQPLSCGRWSVILGLVSMRPRPTDRGKSGTRNHWPTRPRALWHLRSILTTAS